MSLRLKLNLIVAALMGLFVAVLISLQIDATRRSVQEEVTGANRVATQLLQRITWITLREGMPALKEFLTYLGRVRANDLTLLDSSGTVLYRSPPITYKAGRDAPAWFAHWVLPPQAKQEIELAGGKLIIEANASRAVLDGWDELLVLLELGGVALLLINVGVFWLVGRAVKPFATIVTGLERLETGDLSVRLPDLPGEEASRIGGAFNRMAVGLEQSLEARRRAIEAESRLSENRELSQLIEQHLEAERREIARELHDELGQSVTAMHSLAASLQKRFAVTDPSSAEVAGLIGKEAGKLYDAMHGLIPRLTPLTLDNLGLADTLRDLVEEQRLHHPEIHFDLALGTLPASLGGTGALAAYRCAQEAVTNALRHSGGTAIRVSADADDGHLRVIVEDNGNGLPHDWQRPGHFGLRGLRERLESLGGALRVSAGEDGKGTRIEASIPLKETT